MANPVITFNISINNNSGKDVSLDGRLKFVLGNPDHNGVYFGGYQGNYLRTDDIYFSSSSVTISAGSTANFQNLTWMDADTGLGLGDTSPLNPSYLPILDDHGEVAYARNILLYVGGNSSVAVCDNLSPTIIFAQDGTYEINITSYSGGGSSGGDSGGSSEGGGGSSEGGDSGGSGGGSEGGGESGGESGGDSEITDTRVAVTVPAMKSYIPKELADTLWNMGYRKARAVVVYPSPQDRKVVCQGVVNPTMYTTNHRGNTSMPEKQYLGDLFAQSSWFFRPKVSYRYPDDYEGEVVFSPCSAEGEIDYQYNGIYTTSQIDNSATKIKRCEIQGYFKDINRFKVAWRTLTFHSPDIEFDTNMYNLDYNSTSLKHSQVGSVEFVKTLSDIDIQTETPAISEKGSGFDKKSFKRDNSQGIVSGLFWDDYCVDENRKDSEQPWVFEAFKDQKASAKWMVYLWNKKGSLNNDVERPADTGVRSAVLKQKIISNLRYATTNYSDETSYNFLSTQLFNSDVESFIKLKGVNSKYSNLYKGNVDTMLVPDDQDGMYFAIDYTVDTVSVLGTVFTEAHFNSPDFEDPVLHKTFAVYNNNNEVVNRGIFHYVETGNANTPYKWDKEAGDFGVHAGDGYTDLVMSKTGVRMQYKSTPHLVMVYPSEGTSIYSKLSNETLPIFELQRTIADNTIFGGTSDDALKENVWIPCGEPVSLWDGATDAQGNKVFKDTTYYYSWGDTYFQRWDCLKTYAYTPEDINQVVEIGSFMLESYINIDGRYDRNRGQLNNLYMSPRNFNLLNPVYSQINNFFSYRRLDEDAYKRKWYPNQITWSKTKTSGAEVDLWTNVTLASVMEMDGDKGTIRKLIRQNNELFSFQDKGIAQVLYNQNVQISATNGTPIEIANSGKVDGKRYFTDSVGCSNKWSMAQTPMGIYFMDSLNKDIFLFNGQLQNLSGTLGFNSWAKQNIPGVTEETMWTPNYYNISTEDGVSVAEQGFNNFVSYQDKLNQDVLFINKDIALAYSEKFGAFTSFYSYGGTPYFCNLDDMGVWVQNFMAEGKNMTRIWKHNGGKYCHFFADGKDATKPYWTILIGNPEPQMDKIFTNLEFRVSVDGDGELKNEAGKFSFTLPFDFLETWDEYQHGYTALSERDGHNASLHHTNDNISSLKRKFRMWRCDIPRNNCLLDADRIQGLEYSTDAELGVSRHIRKPNDRMRNPWLYLKLMKQGDTSNRTEIHDLLMIYFV